MATKTRNTVNVKTGPRGASMVCKWRRESAGYYVLERVSDGRKIAEVARTGTKWTAWSLLGSSIHDTMADAKWFAVDDCVLYDVIRYRFRGNNRTILRGVRLSVAQAHCRDPKTRKDGVWFDGYTVTS